MQIILEGVDASGKSTLAKELLRRLPGYAYRPSEGPEKEQGEILKRIKRYNENFPSHVVFDRHPIISHPIYSRTVDWMSDIPFTWTRDFYSRPQLIVYCQPTERGFDAHEEVEGVDTAEHLAMVKQQYTRLLADYNDWALRRAHMVYRCGENFDATIHRIVKAVS